MISLSMDALRFGTVTHAAPRLRKRPT